MANWNEILDEISEAGSIYDVTRRKYLADLFRVTNRNIIVYYSGWLQKPGIRGVELNDADKNGFMNAIHGLDRSLGLDLILHTPGGEFAATESLVDYLRAMFDGNIRAVVPQLAMSAGTMIACACKEIVMGKQSSLGPIDPQLGGVPAHGIVEEFYRAHREIREDQSKAYIWQPIIAKYHPVLVGECEKAIQWANETVSEWLKTGMLKDKTNAGELAEHIVTELGDHALTKSHSRHISAAKCKQMGLEIVDMEANQEYQDAVLSVHHACIHTLSSTRAIKIIENHNGVAYIQQVPIFE